MRALETLLLAALLISLFSSTIAFRRKSSWLRLPALITAILAITHASLAGVALRMLPAYALATGCLAVAAVDIARTWKASMRSLLTLATSGDTSVEDVDRQRPMSSWIALAVGWVLLAASVVVSAIAPVVALD
jgi:hypothetical protein